VIKKVVYFNISNSSQGLVRSEVWTVVLLMMWHCVTGWVMPHSWHCRRGLAEEWRRWRLWCSQVKGNV